MKLMRFSAVLLLVASVAVLSAQPAGTRTIDGVTYKVHKVVSGETLYKLAGKYQCSVQSIKEANGGSDQIKIGQELLIPTPASEAVATPEITPAVSASGTVHTVKSGETLSKIARDFGVGINEIKTLNGLSSNDIRIGQVLKIPALGTAPTPDPVEPVTVVPQPVVQKPNVQAPDNPRKTSEPVDFSKGESQVEKAPQGGIPESTTQVLTETATEKEETANAVVVESGMDQTRTFVKHPTLPKGSIVVVINQSTGKMAYCRVVENLNGSETGSLAVTRAVADKIGLKGNSGEVTIKYATP